MINRDDLIKTVNLICQDFLKEANKIADAKIPTEIHYEHDSLMEFLSNFQLIQLTSIILNRYKLNGWDFLNHNILSLPVRHLACYILLNSEV